MKWIGRALIVAVALKLGQLYLAMAIEVSARAMAEEARLGR